MRMCPPRLPSSLPPVPRARLPFLHLLLLSLAWRLRLLSVGQHLANLRRKTFDHITSQFPFFALIFDEKLFTVVFECIFAAHAPDFLDDEHENFLWASVAVGALGGVVADVAAGYVCGAIGAESNAVRHFLSPS